MRNAVIGQRLALVIGAAILGFCWSGDASAQSNNPMWQRRDPRATNLFSDVKALRRGDLLTVLINEKSDVQNRDRRLMDKKGNSSLTAEGNYGISGGIGNSAGGITADQTSSALRKFAGNTQYRSEREFADQFAVTVEDVLPNGNLLIVGTRNVVIEGDRKTLVLTGVVRQYDVTYANTVSSQFIASLDITYSSAGDQGAEQRFINQGWWSRKLNWLWPH